MKMKRMVVGIALGFAFPCAAMSMGLYAGVEGGSAAVADQTNVLARDLVNAYGGYASVTQDINVGMFRGFIGDGIIPGVALEAGYVQTGDVNIDYSGYSSYYSTSYAGTGTVSIHGFDFSGVLHPILLGPGSGLFLRAGISDYTEEANLTVNGLSNSTSQSGTGENFGIGYDFGVGLGDLRTELTFSQNIANDSSSKATSLQVGYYW